MHPDTPSDPPLQSIVLGSGRLGYTDEGEGSRVIVAVHGLPGSVRDFRWIAPTFGPELRFLRVNLAGYGDSERRQGYQGMSGPQRAEAVLELLDALEIERASLMGHSSGGMVIAHLAQAQPERIEQLYFLSCAGPRPHYPLWLWRIVGWLLEQPLRRQLLRPLLRAAYKMMGFPSYLSDDTLIHTTLDAARTDYATYRRNLARVSQPCLVAWAEDDALIPVDIFEALARGLPAGPRLPFAQGGHNIQKTQAVELGEAIVAMEAERGS